MKITGTCKSCELIGSECGEGVQFFDKFAPGGKDICLRRVPGSAGSFGKNEQHFGGEDLS